MKISQIGSQQNFNGTLKAFHNARKKAFYGMAAGCALVAATCGFSYAKNANPGGYRSSTHMERPITAKEVLELITASAGFIGGLFALKKAEDEKEAEELCNVKENIAKKKSENADKLIETINNSIDLDEVEEIEEMEAVDEPATNNKTKYFINKNFRHKT